MDRRLIGGLASAVAATVGALALTATPVSAHVTIDTIGEAEQGEFAKLGFSVPNERDDAGTVELSVQLPQDEPLAFVSVQAKPGWEIATTTRTLDEPIEVFGAEITEVVDTITWTGLEGTQINPGEFDWFWISVGPLPTGVDTLAFPAVQTYSSGEEVAWIEPVGDDGAEPEHPAPTLDIERSDAGE
jgi:uncharacterized protein YcnI